MNSQKLLSRRTVFPVVSLPSVDGLLPSVDGLLPDGLQDDVQAVRDSVQKFQNITSTNLKDAYEHIIENRITVNTITGGLTTMFKKVDNFAFATNAESNPNGMGPELPDESEYDNDDDDDEDVKNDAMLQTLLKNIETLKPLMNKKKTNATKKENVKAILKRIETKFGWEVKGYHNLDADQLKKRSLRPNAPLDEDVIEISNGFYDVQICKDHPRIKTIVSVIEMMNKTSEIKVIIKKDDDVSFDLEEVKIESSNELLYLSGLEHHSKFIACGVLIVQIAMFYLCYEEASANEVVRAALNVSLIMIRLFVAVSFSFSMTNSFTDCWLTMATKYTSKGCNSLKLLLALPNIIVAFVMNSLILAWGFLRAGYMCLEFVVAFILRAVLKLISLCGLRKMNAGETDIFQIQLPIWEPHMINQYLFVPTAFILESAINVFGCIAVLVVTKQLNSPINTVANFAGLMMILEFDSIIIDFMNLPKILSLKVEKHNKAPQSELVEYDIEKLEEERPPISTAPTAKQDTDKSAESKEQNAIKELKFSIFVYLAAISSVYLLM